MSDHRVTFDRSTYVHLVPCHREMSSSEHRDCWYSPEDFERMQDDIIRTVREIRCRRRENNVIKEVDNEELCERGLEHLRSAAHMEQRRINKDCCEMAVMEEQDRQFELNIFNEEDLANASRMGSKWSRDRARQVGLEDEVEVRRIRLDDIQSFQRRHKISSYHSDRNHSPIQSQNNLLGRAVSICESGKIMPGAAAVADISAGLSLNRLSRGRSVESVLSTAARSPSPVAVSGAPKGIKVQQQLTDLKRDGSQTFSKDTVVAAGGFPLGAVLGLAA